MIIFKKFLGYGFSDGAARSGLHTGHVAVIFKNLMNRLGFGKYYVQGGDWGAAIVQNMAVLFPEHIYGVHSSGCFSITGLTSLKLLLGDRIPSLVTRDPEEQEIMFPLSKILSFLILESGYLHLQATKPDTVGK